ncbi:phosphoglycerate dehydrogenase [Puniceicoccus vermicola]|uniref:D-3-phosphoglycerate dehydrogenase n=1 Tax=Puniceicoccus vermicola TaxID=388746 RepID=A0A7X1E6Q0_9BACT|nr:phosphoglycerate dehydrogenase [Puniceicoccus vermicola]MBC2604356.1 phosphoglycerate dehydrogenase [Puniceicoccus vermicola]
MKILVADKISPTGVEFLREQPDCEVIEAYGSSPEKILELVSDVDGIAVRSETKVTAEVIAAAPKLKVVGRAGVGVDNIDIEAATDRGIIVMNTPAGNTIATAELTFTHILAGTRPIAQADRSMKEGRWDRKILTGSELMGKTLGVCGMGRIGAEVSKRALAFGMTVLAFDPFLTQSRAQALGVEMVSFENLCERADYITVHMPLTEETKHMIDADAIARMKDGVRLFNCARGGIIEQQALIEGLKSGKVAAAGLDVYEGEPLDKDSELRKIDSLVLTPHLGASTKEAQENVGIEIAENMFKALTGGTVLNAINMPTVDPRDLKMLAPYLDLGEKLGTFVQQLSSGTVEKLKITYYGKIVDLDALPLSRAIQRGYLQKISGEAINDVNAPKKIASLGVEVDVIKSNKDCGYTELIEVEAIEDNGKTRSACGTLFGLGQEPRIVAIDGHGLEINTSGTLLVLKNKDVPGIVGFIGTSLDKDGVNIANLSLSRDQGMGYAISVYELDTAPSEATQKAITDHGGIEKFKIIQL